MLTLETAVWCYWSYTGSSQGSSKICTKYELSDLQFLKFVCPSRPLCYYSCNVWPSGSRFHGQHMAVWIFRFHGCSRSLFRHEPHSWCSQRVSSIRQCFALGTGSAQKVLLPPHHCTFFSRQINVAISRYIIQIGCTFSFKLLILTNWKLGKGNMHSIFQS